MKNFINDIGYTLQIVATVQYVQVINNLAMMFAQCCVQGVKIFVPRSSDRRFIRHIS